MEFSAPAEHVFVKCLGGLVSASCTRCPIWEYLTKNNYISSIRVYKLPLYEFVPKTIISFANL